MEKTQNQSFVNKRAGIVTFTCLSIWLFVIPTVFITFGKMTGLPGFWNAPNVNIDLPLPAAVIPMALFIISTIGLWQRRTWGILLYGLAGLISSIFLSAQPGMPGMILIIVHLAYTLNLYKKMQMD